MYHYNHSDKILPELFKNIFTKNSDEHYHNTREKYNFRLNQMRTNLGRNAPMRVARKLWNGLAEDLKGIQHLPTFIRQIQRNYIKQYT